MDEEGPDDAAPLWSFRFPKLERLKVAVWRGAPSIESQAGIEFFLAHIDTLKRIGMKLVFAADVCTFQFCLPKHSSSTYQLAISFVSADLDFIRHLAQHCEEQTKYTLERLELSSFTGRRASSLLAADDLNSLLRFLEKQEPPPFPALRDVYFPLYCQKHVPANWSAYDLQNLLSQIRRTARVLGGSIEIWSGCIPPIYGITPQMLGDAFSLFPKIKKVQVSPPTTDVSEQENFVKELALICGTLEEVGMKDYGHNIRTFKIERCNLRSKDPVRLVEIEVKLP